MKAVNNMETLNVNNLTKSFDNNLVLDDITFHLKNNQIIGLFGMSGGGKTTLLKIINQLIPYNKGEILINGEKPNLKSKSLISYLPDCNFLDLNITVSEAIEFFNDFYEDFDSYKAYELIEMVKINTTARVKTLSKGDIELVQLILVISRSAQFYLLDEPIASIDPINKAFILDVILNNVNENSTLLIASNHISDIEPYLDIVIFLKDGKIVLNEYLSTLLINYDNLFDVYKEVYL